MSEGNGDVRVAFIAGGTSSVGAAVAERFLAEPRWRVCVCGSSVAKVEVLNASHAAQADRYLALVCDLTKRPERDAIIDVVLRRFGQLDVLVNSAGGSESTPAFAFDQAEWDHELALNLEAAAALSVRALNHMRSRDGGRIVNIGSIYGALALNQAFYPQRASGSGDFGPLHALGYAAAKGGLVNLTRELAVIGGPHQITVNCVAPGMLNVPTRPIGAEQAEGFVRMTPLGRMGTAEDIAGAVVFLAGRDASFITGQTITVDGGWSIW